MSPRYPDPDDFDEPADLDVDPGTLAGGVPLRTAVSHPDEKRLADEAADRYETWLFGDPR